MIDNLTDSDKLIIENVIEGEALAHAFGRAILLSDMGTEDTTLKAMIRFRAVGQLMSAYAEAELRVRAGDDEEAQRQVQHTLARVDSIVADGARHAEQAILERGAGGN